MAKTWGYAISGFTSGFQKGIGLGMENKKIKMLQEEQKRAEKLAKEKEENAMNWLNSNEDNLMNFHTQSQDVRNMLILESINYKKEWTDYLRDVEDFLQSGDLEGLKHLNNMEEEKIKAERDMLGFGIRPENAFIGKYYSEADMEYVKKLQMGKLPIKPIGKKMYEEEFGELPAEAGALSAADRKYNWAIKHYDLPEGDPEKISFEQLSKFMGTDISDPEKRNTIQQRLDEMDKLGATTEEKKNYLLGRTSEPTPPVPTTTENVREAIKEADTIEDARRINKNYIDKYGEGTLDIDDVDRYWAEGQTIYLDNIKTAIGNITDEKGWLKKGTLTSAEAGLDFKGDQKVEDIYEMLRKEYMKYRDALEKLGIDISQFPELKPLEEIEKVGLGEGFWGFGIQRGQYKSIYK